MGKLAQRPVTPARFAPWKTTSTDLRAGRDWHGQVGVVTRLVTQAAIEPARTVAFVCGPETMMRFILRELERKGVGLDQAWVSL